MKVWSVNHRTNRANGIRRRRQPARQAKPAGTMRVRDYHWNDLEAAQNDRETVVVIRGYLERQRRMLLTAKVA